MVSRTRKNNFSLSPFAPENLASRDGFDSPVPRQSAHLYKFSRLNLVLSNGIPHESRGGVHLFIQTAIRHRVSPVYIGSRNSIPMAFTTAAASPLAQGQ